MMKMNDNLFPPIEPKHAFKEKLKQEVMEVYAQHQKPRLNWRWLLAPGVALASLLLVITLQTTSPSNNAVINSEQNSPKWTENTVPSQQAENNNENESGEKTDRFEEQERSVELADSSQDFSEVEKELRAVTEEINTDSDLEAAIAFSNL